MLKNKLGTENRMEGLDVLRPIFILVMCYIHSITSFSSVGLVLTRVIVPGFFMITGYFLHNTLESGRLKKQLYKTLKLFFCSWAIYLVWDGLKAIHNHVFLQYLTEQFNPTALFRLVFLNQTVAGGHIWFLLAQFWGLLVIGVLYRMNWMKLLYPLSVLGLLALLVFGKYSIVFLHTDIMPFYTQNTLCVAIPFLSLGMLLRKKGDIWIQKISVPANVTILLLGYAIAEAERALLLYFDVMGSRDFYIGTILSTVMLLLLVIRYPSVGRLHILAVIGSKYTSYMYIIHVIMLDISQKLLNFATSLNPAFHIFMGLKFVIAFFLSLIFAILCEKVFSYFKRVRRGDKIK